MTAVISNLFGTSMVISRYSKLKATWLLQRGGRIINIHKTILTKELRCRFGKHFVMNIQYPV